MIFDFATQGRGIKGPGQLAEPQAAAAGFEGLQLSVDGTINLGSDTNRFPVLSVDSSESGRIRRSVCACIPIKHRLQATYERYEQSTGYS